MSDAIKSYHSTVSKLMHGSLRAGLLSIIFKQCVLDFMHIAYSNWNSYLWKIYGSKIYSKHFTGRVWISSGLSWVHTWTLSIFFSTLSDELQRFHSDSTLRLSNKTLMQSVYRQPIESCVMSVKQSWSWTFFNSWSSITLGIAFWYQSSDRRSWPQKQKCPCERAMKKRLAFE